MPIHEITFFSENSSKIRSWSNIPFFFTQTLVKRGIKVNRVPTFFNRNFRRCIWNPFCLPVLNRLFKGHCYTFEMLPPYRFFIKRRIEKAVKKYPNADLNLYCSYDYIAKNTNIPNILFSDWTIEYVIRNRLKRPPFRFEQPLMAVNRENIYKANLVFSLFPDLAEEQTALYGKTFHCLSQNVINNAYDGSLDETEISAQKQQSDILLFVGKKHYLQGALSLVQAFKKLKTKYPALELHIIGMKKKHFGNKLPDGVFCHGYLDKSKKKDRQLYYDLFLKTKCFINPTALWAGFSSMTEAMYFYTPVITSRYSSFVHTFGHDINFGLYLPDENSDTTITTLTDYIHQILSLPASQYAELCHNAHEAVKDFTWEHYVDEFLRMVEQLLPKVQ